MSDHEILLELLEEKRRNDRQRLIERIITLTIIVALIVVLVLINAKFTHVMKQVQENIDRVNTATQEITTFFAGFKAAGYESAEQALKDLHNATTKINTFFDLVGDNVEQSTVALNDFKDWLVSHFK